MRVLERLGGISAPTGRWFAVRQICIALGAAFAYFAVRGLTEGAVATADRNARALLDLERVMGLDLELGLQEIVRSSSTLTTLMNWVYIWLHWPVLIATLAWLLRTDRAGYLFLRNSMMVSGAIGLVIFATFPMTPPRLLDADFLDTVTEYSHSYRVLQPPMFMDRYAAFPSLHFGWNLLAGIAWARHARGRFGRWSSIAMPVAMAIAVVGTANHWVLDVVGGAVVALTGHVAAEWWSRRGAAEHATPTP